jgi:hypothetical protein
MLPASVPYLMGDLDVLFHDLGVLIDEIWGANHLYDE